MRPSLAFAALLLLPATALPAQSPAVSPAEIIAAAPASDWQPIDAANLLLLRFAGGRDLVIALAEPFAPGHVANIRRLVADGWFQRHAAVVRVQENYVVQWGAAEGTVAPLPAGVEASPAGGYERPGQPVGFVPLPFADAYGATVGHARGWPVATDGQAHWLPHCPGMVGVGRDMPPDTGSGAELYVVIGHGPRHLDRNIALVGRVLEGMEHLSALPRGSGPLGFYEQPAQQIRLEKAQLAIDLPAAQRPRFAILSGASLARWVAARADRRDAFFVRPAGAADICNLLPPVRRLP